MFKSHVNTYLYHSVIWYNAINAHRLRADSVSFLQLLRVCFKWLLSDFKASLTNYKRYVNIHIIYFMVKVLSSYLKRIHNVRIFSKSSSLVHSKTFEQAFRGLSMKWLMDHVWIGKKVMRAYVDVFYLLT
jgi:hypothetical protein